MLMGESPVENQTNTPANQTNRQQNNRDGKIPGAIFLSRKYLVQVNVLNLYLKLSACLHRLVSEALEAQAVLRWNHLCLSYPPKWPLAMFLNLYFPHSSSGSSQKLRWRDPESSPLPNPSMLLERKSVDPICSTSMWLLRAKCRPSALFPCITTIVRCLQSGLPWIQPSQQCHCNLLKNVKLILLLCCLKAFIGCLLDKVLKSLSGC